MPVKLHPQDRSITPKGRFYVFSPSRILVPTDVSEQSDRAIREALDIAKRYDSEVVVLHVARDPVQLCTVDYCLSEDLMNRFAAESMEAAFRAVRDQLVKFRSMGDMSIRIVVRTGVPHDMILKEADDEKIDLIVIAVRKDTPLGKHFLGSVANHLLRDAKCQVLLVK